jgi:hypothetical protein
MTYTWTPATAFPFRVTTPATRTSRKRGPARAAGWTETADDVEALEVAEVGWWVSQAVPVSNASRRVAARAKTR